MSTSDDFGVLIMHLLDLDNAARVCIMMQAHEIAGTMHRQTHVRDRG